MKPKIGVSMSREYAGGHLREYLNGNYVDAVVRGGGVPILLPNVESSVQALALCDGLLLTGGGDFDPSRYGMPDRGTDWADVSSERDAVELALMHEADRRGIPIFGICRGIQGLAVGFGGSLVQDIPSVFPQSPIRHSRAEPRRRVTHRVDVVPDTLTARILGVGNFEVNSFHHQAVDHVPPGWIVSARAEDQVIEAIERPGSSFVMGVQWHPENLVRDDEVSRRLFEAFIRACSGGQ
jgi:putative glutamine amidotransferase